VEVTIMSSAEESTLVFGRWLRPIVFVLSVVRRLQVLSTSSAADLKSLQCKPRN